MHVLTYILIAVGILLLLNLMWRMASQYISIPCPAWLGWMVEQDNPFSKNNRAAAIIEHAGIKPGMNVADAGCGPGRVTIPLAKAVGPTGSVTALDIQEAMLLKVRAKATAANLTNIRYLNAGLGQGKLEPNSFDRIFLVTVIGEIPDHQAALQEIFNALKPGGILSVTEIILDPHYKRLSPMRELADSLGFRQHQLFEDWCSYTLNLVKSE